MSKKIQQFSDFEGLTITGVDRPSSGDELIFTFSDGEKYKLYHSQDCCESVYLEDVTGDFEDLIGSPIRKAEEVTSGDDPENCDIDTEWRESFTWTFYHISTFKGTVSLRWYGSSNGYYSERVDIAHWIDGYWDQIY